MSDSKPQGVPTEDTPTPQGGYAKRTGGSKFNPTKSLPEVPSKRAYLVHKLKTEITVAMLGNKVDLPVKDLADGCIGVSLWFDTMEHAVDYGGADAEYSQGEVTDMIATDSSQDTVTPSRPGEHKKQELEGKTK